MLKFFIIVFLIGFLAFKVLGLFFRVLVGGSAADRSGQRQWQNQQFRGQQQYRRDADGNVHIDYVPKDKSKGKSKEFKGGEYVEYEEID